MIITKVYYLEYNEKTIKRIEEIIDKIICFVWKEFIEMNYIELVVKCKEEDVKTLEEMIKDLV